MAHIPPIVVWYSRDSLCCGVGARVAYITAKAKKLKNKRGVLMDMHVFGKIVKTELNPRVVGFRRAAE